MLFFLSISFLVIYFHTKIHLNWRHRSGVDFSRYKIRKGFLLGSGAGWLAGGAAAAAAVVIVVVVVILNL